MRMYRYGVCLTLIVCSVLSTFAVDSHVVWMEAEAFEHTGGWVNDPQFVDLMGSPYLLANGVDRPVEDAFSFVTIPSEGTYTLWVRCKDWLPEYSPGTFTLAVNGQKSEVTFGKSNDDQWKWIDGGQFTVPKGQCEIRLQDTSGWWGRCDAIVLTNDPSFVPANDLLKLELQRVRYFDPYKTAKTIKKGDVVVVGGGLAGSAAAVQAARLGCNVVLLQDRPVLGGNASSEIQVAPGGDNSREPLDPMETGIIEDFYTGTDRGFDHDWSAGIEKTVLFEPNIDLRLNTRAINVIMSDEKTIDAVVAIDVNSGQRMIFPGEIFIDCTGDGWIGFWSGAVYRKGRESQSEFNESLAPVKSDKRTMGNTLMVAKFIDSDTTPFVCPPWAPDQWKSKEDFEKVGTHFGLNQVEYPLDKDEMGLALRFTYGAGARNTFLSSSSDVPESDGSSQVRMMPSTPDHYRQYDKGKGYLPRNKDGAFFQWWAEHGGMMDTIYDAEKIRDELFLINLGMWNYVKNHDPKFKEENKSRRLSFINHVPGKRESRRLVGDYIMTQWDYEERVIHDDNVAYGGWGIDTHHPRGFWKKGEMYYSAYRGHKVSIPFRSLYSRNIDNLMMAGRNISLSHVALGGVRVMRTTCLMGQATGAAASVCIENNVKPREAARNHIAEIQQRLMKAGTYIMGQRNQDPDDLALNAKVTASSVKTIVDPRVAGSKSTTPLIHPLNMQRAVMFKVGSEKLDTIALFLRSKNANSTPIVATLRSARAFTDFSSKTNLATAKAEVPANSMGWVTFKFNQDVDPNTYYYVCLPQTNGLQWDLFPMNKKETCRAYGGPNWVLRNECYKFLVNTELTAPVDAEMEIPKVVLNPENIIDGHNRAVNGVPYSWGPDPKEDLPQWIELAFDKEQTFNTVQISFQNNEYTCTRHRVEAWIDGEWKTIVSHRGVRRRRYVHYFDSVQSNKIRLVLEAPAFGDGRDSAQVCEIRVYNEKA
jgi:hypothetical protein